MQLLVLFYLILSNPIRNQLLCVWIRYINEFISLIQQSYSPKSSIAEGYYLTLVDILLKSNVKLDTYIGDQALTIPKLFNLIFFKVWFSFLEVYLLSSLVSPTCRSDMPQWISWKCCILSMWRNRWMSHPLCWLTVVFYIVLVWFLCRGIQAIPGKWQNPIMLII